MGTPIDPDDDDIEDHEHLSSEVTGSEVQALKDLIESKGWAILQRIAAGQSAGRKDAIMVPATPDTVWEQEFKKGECKGFDTLIALPKIIVDMWLAEKKAAEAAAKEDENGTGTA